MTAVIPTLKQQTAINPYIIILLVFYYFTVTIYKTVAVVIPL